MADTVATAAGIAGIVSVLQSLLQCYKDFLTARSFADDFTHLQLRAALLENSTFSWAVAVGLLDESGAELNKLLIDRPTDQRAGLVRNALKDIFKRLKTVKNELDNYVDDDDLGSDVPDSSNNSSIFPNTDDANDRPSRRTRIANKIHRMIHREHDSQHPGTLKRIQWAELDKSALEAQMDKVTQFVDRLNTDFPPTDDQKQIVKYCEIIRALEPSKEDIQEITEAATDATSKRAMVTFKVARETGNRIEDIKMSKDAAINIGDYIHKEFEDSKLPTQRASNNTVGKVSATGQASINVGDTYGGEIFFQIRAKMQAAAREAKGI